MAARGSKARKKAKRRRHAEARKASAFTGTSTTPNLIDRHRPGGRQS